MARREVCTSERASNEHVNKDEVNWTEELCLNLIELYHGYEVLWNPRDKNYYKNNLKQDAWQNIDKAMNMPAEICKNKMVTLLSCFRREKMKVQKSYGTGKGTSEIYESQWFAFKALNFIMTRYTPRKRHNTAEDDRGKDDVAEVQYDSTEVQEEQAMPIKRSTKENPKLQMLKSAFEILQSAASKNNENSDEELKSFLNFIGAKMRKYDECTKNALQQEICQLIFKADNNLYRQPLSTMNLNPANTTYQISSPQVSNMGYATPTHQAYRGYYTVPYTQSYAKQQFPNKNFNGNLSNIVLSSEIPSKDPPSTGQSPSPKLSSAQSVSSECPNEPFLSPQSDMSELITIDDLIYN